MPNPQQSVNAHERRLEALKLRLQGLPYHEIARRLGYRAPSGAWGAVRSAMNKQIREPAQELITMELTRLDELFYALWPNKQNPNVVDRILKVMERRAKLLGLDAPEKHDVRSDMNVVIDWEQIGGDSDSG